ncbi:MAG: FtsX-like permease family protein [Roseivirga sp.]|nr:FtsX-like permease family protein [Roseivirga sp.]
MKNADNHITPPRLAKRILLWFLKDDLAEEVLGDLDEKFHQTVYHHSQLRARWNYWFQVLNYLRPFALKRKRSPYTNQTAMFKHNLLISFRSFKRYKSTFLINLFGLATGLASALLIYLWVNDEMQMGQFKEKDSDRHYQLYVNSELSDGIHTREHTPFPLVKAIGEELPEVKKAISIYDEPYYKGVISFDGNDLRAVPLFVSDGYFDVIGCDFVAGSKTGALNNENVVISLQLANSLFSDPQKAIGQTVNFTGQYYKGPYVVSGVFKPNPRSTVNFDILINIDHFLSVWRTNLYNWYNGGPQTHLVLQEGVDLDEFNTKIEGLLNKLKGGPQTLIAQKYSDKYLYGKFENGVPVAGRMVYVRIFTLIAISILIIACINYMNLSTAQASRRVKEIGVKKAIGADRRNLIYQYFSESLFISFIALLLAVGIVLLLLPQFNTITGKSLSIGQASSIVITTLIVTLATGLISGIYPGLYLSGFKPILALKGKLQSKSGGLLLRKGLVVFQFAISVILIITVVVIYRQMNFIKVSNLGYDTEHVISFTMEGKLRQENPEPFLAEIRKLSGIVNISHLWGELPGDVSSSSGFRWKGQIPEQRNTKFNIIEGGYDIEKVLGIELIEGRFFSREFATDDKTTVINQFAANLFGFENTIGEQFDGREIIGIVKDFHSKGFHDKIGPFFFRLNDSGEYFVAKIQAGRQIETIQQIEALYSEFNPGYPFEFKFIDDKYQQLYLEEERTATLSKYFSAIAISISCLGLLALTAFSTQRRFKEIAIRKVLGSNSFGIVRLLSGSFIGLIFLALLIGLPIGHYLMKNWLDGFAYRIDLEPGFFIIAGALMLLVAWVTIMTQTAKSANVNITESLRSE